VIAEVTPERASGGRGKPASLELLRTKRPSTQVAIAGGYAWAVTVAPAAALHGATGWAKVTAGLGFAALVGGVVAEPWWPGRARVASLASFVAASVATWMLAPAALKPVAIDTIQGLAGMLGWGLFALASAAPALGAQREVARVVEDAPLEPRRKLARGDGLYLAGGAAFAIALQGVGWDVVDAERALLVRLVTVAAGLAMVGASVEIALARHETRVARSARHRWRRAAPALAFLAALALSGLLLVARG
jgi:hypothetical protein